MNKPIDRITAPILLTVSVLMVLVVTSCSAEPAFARTPTAQEVSSHTDYQLEKSKAKKAKNKVIYV